MLQHNETWEPPRVMLKHNLFHSQIASEGASTLADRSGRGKGEGERRLRPCPTGFRRIIETRIDCGTLETPRDCDPGGFGRAIVPKSTQGSIIARHPSPLRPGGLQRCRREIRRRRRLPRRLKPAVRRVADPVKVENVCAEKGPYAAGYVSQGSRTFVRDEHCRQGRGDRCDKRRDRNAHSRNRPGKQVRDHGHNRDCQSTLEVEVVLHKQEAEKANGMIALSTVYVSMGSVARCT